MIYITGEEPVCSVSSVVSSILLLNSVSRSVKQKGRRFDPYTERFLYICFFVEFLFFNIWEIIIYPR